MRAWICRLSLLGLLMAGCGGGAKHTRTQTLEVPAANPRAAAKYLKAARLLQRGGEAREKRAMHLLRSAIAIDIHLWEAHHNLGAVLRRRGETRKALKHFARAHEIQPGADEPLIALAEVRHVLGERDTASDLLKTYLDKHADAIDVRIALTAVLRQRGEFDDALQQAREALVRNPTNTRALLEVGRIYRARGDLDVADLVFKKALALDEENAASHNELGLVALSRGDTQLAFQHFADANEADAAYAPARLNRASVLLKAGDYAAAEGEYRRVLGLDKDNLNARVGVGITLRGQGKYGKARREYQRVLDAAPNHPSALFNLAVLRAEFLDQRPGSRELFERFLEVAASDHPKRKMSERYLREIPALPPQQTTKAKDK